MFTRFVRDGKWTLGTCAYELKCTDKNALAFSKVEPHQPVSLQDAKHSILTHKIADDTIGFKPCDGVIIEKEAGYLIILYYKPRQPKECVVLDIDDYLCYVGDKTRGSISEIDARSIAKMIITL